MSKILKNNVLLIVLATLFVFSLGSGIYFLLNLERGEDVRQVENDDESDASDTLRLEPTGDCSVSETACEEMGLFSSCPEGSDCEEMAVGWSSGDMACPTYTILCFEQIEEE
jgi:hypothetical protein